MTNEDVAYRERRLCEQDRSDIQIDDNTLFELVRINNGDRQDTWQNLMRDGPWRIRRLAGDLEHTSQVVVTNGNEVIPWHQVVSLKRFDDRYTPLPPKK